MGSVPKRMSDGDDGGAGRLQVCFLPLSRPGRLGFSVLPGRRGRDEEGRFWTRDLVEDLDRLTTLGVERLVLLVSDAELAGARATPLLGQAQTRGLALAHVPLPPRVGSPQRAEIERLVENLSDWTAQGTNVVLVSGDGLGRAALVAGAFLVREGSAAPRAVATLRKLRGPDCLRAEDEALLLDWSGAEAPPSEPPERSPTPLRTAGAGHVARAYSPSPHLDREEGPLEPPWVRPAERSESSEAPRSFPPPKSEGLESPRYVGGGPSDGSEPPPDEAVSSSPPPPLFRPAPAPSRAPRSRFGALTPVESTCMGALLGAALGDALGAPLEAETRRAKLEARYGSKGPEAPTLSPPPGGSGPECAVASEETQLTLLAVETVVESRLRRLEIDITLSRLSERIGRWTRERRGPWMPEASTLEVAERIRDGTPWTEAASNSERGSSGLVRAIAFGLAFADDLLRAERWAAAQCRVTHRSADAVGAAAGLAVILARFGRGDRLEVVLSEAIASACRYSPRLASRLARAWDDADSGVPPAIFFEHFGEPTARDSLAAALFVVRRHPDDLEGAVREAVMTPGDSDAVGAVVASALGARLGASALPPSWVQVLDGRETLEGLALALAASR